MQSKGLCGSTLENRAQARLQSGLTTRRPEKPKTSDYKEFLFKRLQDPTMAAGYLTACLEEGEEAVLLAVKDVAEARGGIAPLANATHLNREGLYDMLSKKANPRFSSLAAIIDALGLTVQFAPKLEAGKAM
jgi:probable addiction module antidote protein